MNEKVSGYSLLLVGLLIMIFCVVNVFMVFTNKAKPFQVFNTESNSKSESSLNINDLLKQIQSGNQNAFDQSIQQPNIDILPAEVLNQSLNLTTHFFLMSFILGFGYKLASLGTQLIRPINVKLKSNLDPSTNKVN
ncbi:MAG: hypothetical protein HYT07_00690 [Candidatus Levybacteria bacterium]|nr:hypothetical protein [Candidatus Levybacteria bacterium]